MNSSISFNSNKENYLKEESGIKSNTVRFTDDWNAKRWEQYHKATHVWINCKELKKKFKREISDKTQYKNVVIISWR